MGNNKMTFELYFGNRDFFPGEVIASARQELIAALEKGGYGYIASEESATRFGAVETIAEGKRYAEFLERSRGKYDGIILCLPNFGDENGMSAAFKNVDVPVLVQAYPDEMGKTDFRNRRDALCGKLAMCNVMRQLKIKFSLTKQFAVSPLSAAFVEDLKEFAAVCRVVKGMRSFNVGAIGARTTAFKTVRFDEIAMQNRRINVETIDLSCVFDLADKATDGEIAEKKKSYLAIAEFNGFPQSKLDNIARLGVAVDKVIVRYDLQAIAIRCWDEIEKRYGIAPCLVLCELNERGIAAACELDVSNAVMMRALGLAADYPVMLLDVNNNFGYNSNKCVLFHCGPVPISLLKGKGKVEEHLMFKKTYGDGSGVGINKGEIAAGEVTVCGFKTENGKLCAFAAEGTITDDALDKAFFGCGAVFEKTDINAMLNYMAKNGYRHHVCVTRGKWAYAVKEAFDTYLE